MIEESPFYKDNLINNKNLLFDDEYKSIVENSVMIFNVEQFLNETIQAFNISEFVFVLDEYFPFVDE